MFKDLSYLEGQEVEFIHGFPNLTELDDTRQPDRCVVIKDYPYTLLIGMVYEKDFYGRKLESRVIRKAVAKSALYTSDVLLKAHTYLDGKEVYEFE